MTFNHPRRVLRALLAGLLLVMGTAATAAPAGDLGQVTVPLGDSAGGASVDQQALRQGLEEVIHRLTGQSDVDAQPGAAAALQDPRRWLLKYSYQQGSPRALNAVFDAEELGRYLAAQGAPVWSASRPPVLVWLVDQGSGRGDMVSARDETGARLQQAAIDQGLRVTLPKWDETEKRTLTVADVRGRFDGPVLDASRRYDAEWVATAVIYEGARTTINWRLLHGGDTAAQGRDQVASKDAALASMITGITAQMAGRYRVSGVSAGNDQAQDLVVRGVDTLDAWHQLQAQLNSLGAIRSVQLRGARDNALSFAVDFAGARADLADLLDGVAGLRRCDDTSGAAASGAAAPPGSTSLTYCRL
ncbi:hypothetical protein CEK62_08540 [Alcanivorax sp. N3-2A]|nr:hypothetical protein CEK62_08540 [Alcanivorax sp. N3-2A]